MFFNKAAAEFKSLLAVVLTVVVVAAVVTVFTGAGTGAQ